MGKRYRNPPINEALCEFRFEPGGQWDLTILGLVYERIRDQGFPKKRLAKALEASVSAGPEGVRQEVLASDRMQFLSDDEKALIQVSRDLLAVNRLKPYPTWQAFMPLIRQAFEAYRQVANPKGIRHIGLRYINVIEFAAETIELEDYFEFRPFVGPNLPQNLGSFIVGIDIPYEDSRDVLKLQLGTATFGTAGTLAAILDLNYSLAQPAQVSLDTVFEWIEVAHNRIEEVFEACITERMRERFEEVTK